VRHLHDLSGGLVLTLPMEADLRHPEAGQYIRKYLHTKPDVDVEDRMRVYNLIRDLTADAYGGWQFVVALQAGGGRGETESHRQATGRRAALHSIRIETPDDFPPSGARESDPAHCA
jgi:aromatic ring hydroxylase